MNSAFPILLFSLAMTLSGAAVVDLPKKAPIMKYAGLWTNSPFTSKPVIDPGGGPAPTPWDDFKLLGVSPIAGGYRVTMVNTKKPEEKITVCSDIPSKDGYKIVEVVPEPGRPLKTIVHMSSSAGPGTVSFDEKLLVLAVAPTAKAPPKPNQPGGVNPTPQPNPATGAQLRQPRPVITPAPSATPSPTPAGRPGFGGSSGPSRGRSSHTNYGRTQ